MRQNHYEDKDIHIYEEDDIMICNFKQGVVVNQELSSRMIKKRISASGNRDRKMISDCRGVKYWTMSSRNNDMKKDAFKYISVSALVIKNPILGKIWQFTVSLFPTPIEVKVFYNFDEAWNWIKLK